MAIQEVRQCAKANQDLPKIMLEDLDEALATMKRGDRVGSRPFRPSFHEVPAKRGQAEICGFPQPMRGTGCVAMAGVHHVGVLACQRG